MHRHATLFSGMSWWKPVAMALLSSLIGSAPAGADILEWNISSFSYFTVAIPDQTIPNVGILQTRDQVGSGANWTTSTVHTTGKLLTDYNIGSIQFLTDPLQQFVGTTSGSFRPNPAAFNAANVNAANPYGQYSGTSSAGADIGGKFKGAIGAFSTDVTYWSISHTNYSVTSSVIPIVGSGFNAAGTSFTANGLLNMDNLVAPIIGQVLPDTNAMPITVFGGSNQSLGGAIGIGLTGALEMRLPVNLNVPLLAESGIAINGTVVGDITAMAQLTFAPLHDGVLTFDDLPAPLILGIAPIPEGYGGLHWSNFQFTDSRFAYNLAGQPADVSHNGYFDFKGTELGAEYNDGLLVDVRGYRDGVQVYARTVTVHTSGTSWFDFDYLNVDRVSFSGVGDSSMGNSLTEFKLDNFTIGHAVPEPSSMVLALVGAVGFAGLRFRKQRSRMRCE